MGLNESDTRAKLIDPAIHSRGWTEELIRREETAGAVEIIDGKPRKKAKGRVDYTLRETLESISPRIKRATLIRKRGRRTSSPPITRQTTSATLQLTSATARLGGSGHRFSLATQAPCRSASQPHRAI